MGKVKITNINRFLSFLIILVLVVVFSVIILCVVNSKSITVSTDISQLNTSKYSEQILKEYEKEGKKEEFLDYYDEIQSAVGVYIIENSTLEDDSLKNIIDDINSKLENQEYEGLGVTKSNTWNGKWSVDNEGILKFRFDTKSIEPSWATSSELEGKIIFN